MDSTSPDHEQPADGLGPEREVVQRHLERRFPDVDAATVAHVIDRAAEPTAGAKIKIFRPLLVEHRASDQLFRLQGGT